MKTCAVIPAYNEEATVGAVVREAKRYVGYVIVIDDGSEDKTAAIAKDEGAEVLTHVVNMGVGFATITGNNYAIENGYDVIVNLDSDGQHSAAGIPQGIELLEKEKLDIVLGSRFLRKQSLPLILKFGNKFLTYTNKAIFKSDITDTQSGFRIFTRDAWKKLELKSPGYGICSEIASKIGIKKLKYAEIPVDTRYLDKFKGTTILDGIKIFSNMLWWWIRKCFGYR